MDLQTFVSETLVQIVAGVKEAQSKIAELGTNASVNPGWVYETQRKKNGQASPVEFDVALTVIQQSSDSSAERTGGKLKGGVLSVFSAEVGTEFGDARSGSEKSETVSRVKFSVSLAQPAEIDTIPVKSPPSTSSAWG